MLMFLGVQADANLQIRGPLIFVRNKLGMLFEQTFS
jgi:hypothetical protein